MSFKSHIAFKSKIFQIHSHLQRGEEVNILGDGNFKSLTDLYRNYFKAELEITFLKPGPTKDKNIYLVKEVKIGIPPDISPTL